VALSCKYGICEAREDLGGVVSKGTKSPITYKGKGAPKKTRKRDIPLSGGKDRVATAIGGR